MTDEHKRNNPTIYEIKLKGHLDTKWTEWFYDMTIIHESDGTTTLRGPLPDQAVLHSVLGRVRDMNLILINVRKMNTANHNRPASKDEAKSNAKGGPTNK